jgi:hypothetical protein
VEPRGLEPLTPCLQSKCATNCAMAPVRPSPIPREWPGRRTMVRPSSVMNQSQNRHSPTPHYVLHLPISYTWCGDEGSEAECGERSRGDLDPGGSNKPMRSCAPKPPKPPRHAQTESEVPAQHRFHERSHRVALNRRVHVRCCPCGPSAKSSTTRCSDAPHSRRSGVQDAGSRGRRPVTPTPC